MSTETNKIYPHFIAGEWRAPQGHVIADNVNPAHRSDILGKVAEATNAEVAEAVAAADAAFDVWRMSSGDLRTKIFLRVGRYLEDHYDEIVATMTREMGKSHFDSKLDLDEAIGVVEAVAPQGLSMKGETYQRNARGLVMESRLEPRGVAAIITPFNFPVAIPIAQIVSALVTGNTVVWKPSHLIPESSRLIVEAIREALDWGRSRPGTDIPGGVFSMVTGDRDAGEALVTSPAVKCLSFTGSKAVGDAVDAVASGLGKRVMKEVGGINIFYVHKDADIARAAKSFVYGKTITAGQRCTSIQEVICDREVYEEFIAAAIRETAGIRIGDGASKEIADADATPGLYGLAPLVSDEQRDRVLSIVDQAVSEGAKIRHKVDVPEALKGEGAYAPFVMLENVDTNNVLYRTEIFGPVGVLRPVSGIHEAIRLINDRIGIVGCIDSRNKDASEHFIQNVLRTRIDDGRHGTGAFWATRFGGDRGAGSGNPALDENMVFGYVLWKTIYRAYNPITE
jgi:aldehyde dehydrogenase (NAD+)